MPQKCYCGTRAGFNYIGMKPLYCSRHKLNDMVNVYHPICMEIDCSKRASYGIEKPIYCVNHSKEGMIDKNKKYCDFPSCSKKYSFKSNDNKVFRCTEHKEEYTVSIVKKCDHKGCDTTPSFGYENGKITRCSKHKKQEMIFKGKTCIHEKCFLSPTYNYPGETNRLFCKFHADKNMICIVNSGVHRNPDSKEKMTQDFIKNEFPSLHQTYNVGIIGGTSSLKPDIFIDLNNFSIVVEIDERQHSHKKYTLEKENSRLEILTKDARKPVTLIRFNPDTLRNCKVEFQDRLKNLKKVISDNIKKEPKMSIETKLFY